MSLWLANDQSSIPIISNFMHFLKSGLPKDVALQKAKIKYLEESDPLMRDDFYWAGFVLNGDVNSIKFHRYSLKYIVIIFISIIIAYFAAKKYFAKSK
jgi:hypothetical protein